MLIWCIIETHNYTYDGCVLEIKLLFVHTLPYVLLVVDKSEVCSKIWVRKSHHHGHHSLWPTNSQIFWPNSFYLLRNQRNQTNWIVNGIRNLLEESMHFVNLSLPFFFGLQTGDQCCCLRVFKSKATFLDKLSLAYFSLTCWWSILFWVLGGGVVWELNFCKLLLVGPDAQHDFSG